MINLVFEDLENLRNLFDETEVLGDGLYRITTSPYANHLRRMSTHFARLNHGQSVLEFSNKLYPIKLLTPDQLIDGKYIIPVGVNQSPKEWMGIDFVGDNSKYEWKNIFDKLNDRYLTDLREGKAFLMIDNSLEGYHDDFIFTHLYDSAVVRWIKPSQIIYVTGNQNIENCLEIWRDSNRGKESIHVIPYAHFEYDISRKKETILKSDPNFFPSFDAHYNYKQEKYDSIKIYNFLNKKPRDHRMWMFDNLREWNLLGHGIVSMNQLEEDREINIDFNIKPKKNTIESNKLLPMYAYNDDTTDKQFDYYMYNFNTQASLDSWFTVVSETHFNDKQKTMFISEKTFKTIANNHPFMILGNRYTLPALRKMGYKTFHDLIDESYDSLESIHRMNAIIDEIRKWEWNPDKLQHLEWMRHIVEHNSEVLKFNALFNPPSYFFELLKWIKNE